MTFPSGKIYQVNMVFPLCLFVVDIQGAHKLVGMFDLYSQVERPCISCDCIFDNLGNFRVKMQRIQINIQHHQMIMNHHHYLTIKIALTNLILIIIDKNYNIEKKMN